MAATTCIFRYLQYMDVSVSTFNILRVLDSPNFAGTQRSIAIMARILYPVNLSYAIEMVAE